MKWKVLVSAPAMQRVLYRFSPIFDKYQIEVVAPPVVERLSEEQLLKLVEDIDGAISGDDQFSDRVLKAAPRLKVISKWGTGVDAIDLDAAARLSIVVKNSPDAFADPVADTVLGYILCFARALPWMDRDMRKFKWEKLSLVSLHERTLGVIGVGSIGRAVVRRARAFGMRVLGYDLPDVAATIPADLGIKTTQKDDLLRESDFVSLNCTLTRSSFHMIGAREFNLMKPTAIIINTARGALIDEKALVEALRVGRIGGAAVDVFEEEPLPTDSPLRQFDNVMLAPHAANGSPITYERVHENSIRNLLEGLGIHIDD